MANTMRHINIIGHQNPDTDSICSALAYAWLKNRGSLTGLYEARRAGHVNRETRFVLQHFGVEPPRLCTDVSPQIKDIDIRKQAGIDGEMSLRAAWNLMRDVEIDTLCIVDSDNELRGLITIKDIADANMDLFDTAVLAAANTRCTNLLETLEAELVVGSADAHIDSGNICINLSSSFYFPCDRHIKNLLYCLCHNGCMACNFHTMLSLHDLCRVSSCISFIIIGFLPFRLDVHIIICWCPPDI